MQDTLDLDLPSTPTPTEPSPQKTTRLNEYAKTAQAAKLSGAFNKTVGSIKNGLGRALADDALRNSGRDQELLGKAHRFVGALRELKEATHSRLLQKRSEGIVMLKSNGGKLLDVATDCVLDLKKLIFS